MAYGFTPVKHLSGGVIRTNNFMTYKIASAYGTAIYQGDPVEIIADGTIVRSTTPGAEMVGIFKGVTYTDSTTGDVIYNAVWPASTTATNIVAYVWDDPWLMFKAESDQDTTALASTSRGTNVEMVAGTGSNVTKRSGFAINSNTAANTSTLTWRVLGSAQLPGETEWTAAGTTMDVHVMPNVHYWLHIATGQTSLGLS